MKKYFLLVVLLLACMHLTELHAQEVNERKVERFERRLAKHKFVEQIKEERELVYETVRAVKSNSDLSDNQDLQTKYMETKNAYNGMLDSLQIKINAVDDIVEYVTFFPANNLQDELAAALEAENTFLEAANDALRGETAFIGRIVRWLLKQEWLAPLVKGILDDVYLPIVKEKLNTVIEESRFVDWSEIS